MRFNINNYVRVKLNQIGLDELKRQHDELALLVPSIGAWKAPATDEEGFSKFQLWSLMKELGHLCYLGGTPPFETFIEIIEPIGISAPAAGALKTTVDGEPLTLTNFGWAPGGYTLKCIDCPAGTSPMDNWGAKRSWRCQAHAQKKLDEALAA